MSEKRPALLIAPQPRTAHLYPETQAVEPLSGKEQDLYYDGCLLGCSAV
jgi:hypothetical protein